MGQEDAQPLSFPVQLTTLRWTEETGNITSQRLQLPSPSIDTESTAQHLLTVDNLKRTSNGVPHVSVTLLIVQYSWRDPSHSTAPCLEFFHSLQLAMIYRHTHTHTHTLTNDIRSTCQVHLLPISALALALAPRWKKRTMPPRISPYLIPTMTCCEPLPASHVASQRPPAHCLAAPKIVGPHQSIAPIQRLAPEAKISRSSL